jgi:hypothetical protein
VNPATRHEHRVDVELGKKTMEKAERLERLDALDDGLDGHQVVVNDRQAEALVEVEVKPAPTDVFQKVDTDVGADEEHTGVTQVKETPEQKVDADVGAMAPESKKHAVRK